MEGIGNPFKLLEWKSLTTAIGVIGHEMTYFFLLLTSLSLVDMNTLRRARAFYRVYQALLFII